MLTTTAGLPPAREGGIEMVPTKRDRDIAVQSQKLRPLETPRQMGGAGPRHGVTDSRCQAPTLPHSTRNGDALALAREPRSGPLGPDWARATTTATRSPRSAPRHGAAGTPGPLPRHRHYRAASGHRRRGGPPPKPPRESREA
jgi:hypothetical protein